MQLLRLLHGCLLLTGVQATSQTVMDARLQADAFVMQFFRKTTAQKVYFWDYQMEPLENYLAVAEKEEQANAEKDEPTDELGSDVLMAKSWTRNVQLEWQNSWEIEARKIFTRLDQGKNTNDTYVLQKEAALLSLYDRYANAFPASEYTLKYSAEDIASRKPRNALRQSRYQATQMMPKLHTTPQEEVDQILETYATQAKSNKAELDIQQAEAWTKTAQDFFAQ